MIKKIEYIIEDLVTPYVRQNYPAYVELLKLFGSYLDNNNYGKILNIEDNMSSYTIYSELLDLFLGDFFAQNFDLDVYGLTDDNKRRFLDLSQKINSLKGTKESFAVFFQTLTNFTLATSTGNISITDLGQVIYSNTSDPEDICQYNFNAKVSTIEDLESLIDNVHPAGMLVNAVGALYDGTYIHDGTIDYSGSVI